MDPVALAFKQQAETAVYHLKEDFKTIRTGRATPALIEGLPVKTYEGQTTLKLMELSTITTEAPTTLIISPFDPSVIGDIEKAILASSLGLTPQTQGQTILVKIPPLSQEQREKMLKLIGQKVEEKKVQIRNHRDDSRKKLRLKLEQKELAEDTKFRIEKELDLQTQQIMETIQELKKIKEAEIMKV